MIARAVLVTLLALTGGGWSPCDAASQGAWTVGGYAEFYGVVPTDTASPVQWPQAMLDVSVTGDPWRRLHLYLDARGTWGGTPRHAEFGIVNLSDTFQSLSPAIELEEAYADLALAQLDLRIGKQKIAWGKLDTIQPTDVVNPRRFQDPFVLEEGDIKIGIPMVSASYFPPWRDPTLDLSDLALTGIWVPVPVPPQFPRPDERWFPLATTFPPEVRIPRGFLLSGLPAIDVHNTLETHNRPPAQQLDEGAVALRASGILQSVDWAAVYYDGRETSVDFDVQSTVLSQSARRKVRRGLPTSVADLRSLRATTVLLPQSRRMRLAGADGAFSHGGLTVRVEGVYGAGRALPRLGQELVSLENIRSRIGGAQDQIVNGLLRGRRIPVELGDLFVRRDAVQWGLGVDYRYRGWMPLVQVNQTIVLNNATDLLINDVDTSLLFVLRKSFVRDILEAELVGLQGIARGYSLALLRLTYAVTDQVRVRAGGLLIAGSRRTIVGQYHDNDELFLQVRYSF